MANCLLSISSSAINIVNYDKLALAVAVPLPVPVAVALAVV